MSKASSILTSMLNAFRNKYLCFAFRVCLGAVFLMSGISKMSERAEFVELVKEANVLPHALSTVYGTALPYVEIVIGALLVLGLFSRFAAAIGGLSSISFIIGNGTRIHRGLYGECGCFGSIASLQFNTWQALTVDCVMLIVAVQILVHKDEFLSLDSLIFHRKLPPAV
jgi:uncharacterized membrane protein YphA (DoxX/SURF4 family)